VVYKTTLTGLVKFNYLKKKGVGEQKARGNQRERNLIIARSYKVLGIGRRVILNPRQEADGACQGKEGTERRMRGK